MPVEDLTADLGCESGPGPFGLEDVVAAAELAAAQTELAAVADLDAGECSACGALLPEADFYEVSCRKCTETNAAGSR